MAIHLMKFHHVPRGDVKVIVVVVLTKEQLDPTALAWRGVRGGVAGLSTGST
jgi:hypothetical protein